MNIKDDPGWPSVSLILIEFFRLNEQFLAMLVKENVIRFDVMAEGREDVILVGKTDSADAYLGKQTPKLGSDTLWARFCSMFWRKKVSSE
jgi:hypothetical protein